MMVSAASSWAKIWTGEIPRRSGLAGTRTRHLFQSADKKWLSFIVPPYRWAEFGQWCEEEGLGGEFQDPRWRDGAYRISNGVRVAEVIEALCARYPQAELFHEGQRRRLLVMPSNTPAELLQDPQFISRGFFQSTIHDGRELIDTGSAWSFSATPIMPLQRAPAVGQHQEYVTDDSLARAELTTRSYEGRADWSLNRDSDWASQGRRWKAAQHGAPVDPLRPLAGVRVCDFFWLIAGPLTSRILADLGAEVIKIESSRRLDQICLSGLWHRDATSDSPNAVFADCNTGKRSITVNVNDPRGIELIRRLVRVSDIVTNNFSGERMDRWGLGYADLVKVKPDIIMMTMAVMGREGPYRNYRSNGAGVVAYGGMDTNMGFPDAPPIGMGPLYSDFISPFFAITALMSALSHRDRTGQGQFIDLAQASATAALLGTGVLEYSVTGQLPPLLANGARDYAPHGVYRCQGDDRWVALAVREPTEWAALCVVIHRADLVADPGLSTVEARLARSAEIDDAIERWTMSQSAWEVAEALQGAGVMASVVEDIQDMVERDPQFAEHFHHVSGPEGKVPYLLHGVPMRFDGRQPSIRPAPSLGEDNLYVLTEILGLPDSEIAALVADGIIV